MFDKIIMTALNRKMRMAGEITEEEFDKIQKKINLLPDTVFDNTASECYNEKAG